MEVVVRVVRVGRRCVSPPQHGEQAVNWPRPTPGRVRPGRHTPARAGNRLQPHGWVGGGRCRPPRRQQRAPLPGGATTRAAKKKKTNSPCLDLVTELLQLLDLLLQFGLILFLDGRQVRVVDLGRVAGRLEGVYGKCESADDLLHGREGRRGLFSCGAGGARAAGRRAHPARLAWKTHTSVSASVAGALGAPSCYARPHTPHAAPNSPSRTPFPRCRQTLRRPRPPSSASCRSPAAACAPPWWGRAEAIVCWACACAGVFVFSFPVAARAAQQRNAARLRVLGLTLFSLLSRGRAPHHHQTARPHTPPPWTGRRRRGRPGLTHPPCRCRRGTAPPPRPRLRPLSSRRSSRPASSRLTARTRRPPWPRARPCRRAPFQVRGWRWVVRGMEALASFSLLMRASEFSSRRASLRGAVACSC